MSAQRISFRAGQAAQAAALPRVAAHVDELLAGPLGAVLRHARRPVFTGIGASHAVLAVPVQLLRAQGVATQQMLSSELAVPVDGDLVVAVSQSGRSTETIDALRTIEGVPRMAVVNVTPSPLADLAEHAVDLGNEPDSYASTVGFTGTVVALERVAAAVAAGHGVPERAPGSPWRGLGELVAAAEAEARRVVDPLAERAATVAAADVVAAGASRATADEVALLLREVARIPAAASATRAYLHGEMESAGNTLHVVVGDDREIPLARSLAGAGHTTLLVTAADVPGEGALHVARLPTAHPAVRVVLECVVLQELAGALADARGLEIESFVFANDDTKSGGVDPADFLIPSEW